MQHCVLLTSAGINHQKLSVALLFNTHTRTARGRNVESVSIQAQYFLVLGLLQSYAINFDISVLHKPQTLKVGDYQQGSEYCVERWAFTSEWIKTASEIPECLFFEHVQPEMTSWFCVCVCACPLWAAVISPSELHAESKIKPCMCVCVCVHVLPWGAACALLARSRPVSKCSPRQTATPPSPSDLK